MNCLRSGKSRILAVSANLMLALCLAGCLRSKVKHTIQQKGNEGISLGNGEYLFPDEKGEMVAGPLNHPKNHPPAGALIIVPKTKEDVLQWLDRIGVKYNKPIPQETKLK